MATKTKKPKKVLKEWLDLVGWVSRCNQEVYGDITVTFAEMAEHAGVTIEAVEKRQYDIARELRGYDCIEDVYQGKDYITFTKTRMWYEY